MMTAIPIFNVKIKLLGLDNRTIYNVISILKSHSKYLPLRIDPDYIIIYKDKVTITLSENTFNSHSHREITAEYFIRQDGLMPLITLKRKKL